MEFKNAADVVLNAGDILLLEVGNDFAKTYDANPTFGLLSSVPKSSPLKTKLMWPAVALTAAMIITQVSFRVKWSGTLVRLTHYSLVTNSLLTRHNLIYNTMVGMITLCSIIHAAGQLRVYSDELHRPFTQ